MSEQDPFCQAKTVQSILHTMFYHPIIKKNRCHPCF